MNQEWFEMQELRRRKLDKAVWIPLRAAHRIQSGKYGYSGYREEFFGAGSLAVPVDKKEKAERLGWSDVGVARQHRPGFRDGRYISVDIFEDYLGEFTGIPLVLEQRGNRKEPEEWHLHQDFVIALGLTREDDIWLSMNEDYIEVARLQRKPNVAPGLLEVRAEHLKDYLCARNMALYVTSYRSRVEIVDDAKHITWPDNPFRIAEGADRWEGRINAMHEGGYIYGSEIAVFHMWRTDVDLGEDVPTLLSGESSVEG